MSVLVNAKNNSLFSDFSTVIISTHEVPKFRSVSAMCKQGQRQKGLRGPSNPHPQEKDGGGGEGSKMEWKQ